MRSALAAFMIMMAAIPAYSENSRSDVINDALAYWHLGTGAMIGRFPLKAIGQIEFDVDAEGNGAIRGSKCVRLTNAYFDAGKDLHVEGNQITIYLRAYDPENRWDYGLFAKRGNRGIMNYNLFSIGGLIGFEMTTKSGVASKMFPVSLLGECAWHDIVARYDGQFVDMFCDGYRMSKLPWKDGDLMLNDEPALIGAETGGFDPTKSEVVRPFTGYMQEAGIWKRALTDGEISAIMRVDSIQNGPGYREPNTYISALHRRPDVGVLGDTIPFYWQGEYHIFYLHPVPGEVDWNHISTKDFISWKEYPTALRPDGPANGPDGMCMFTGSIIEKDGLFHCFYTGHNPNNPDGLEFIMHATSSDLVAWTKHPEDILRPDGMIYRIGKKSNPNAPWNPADWDFRDPYVFFNQDEGCYWMVFLADDAGTGKKVQGLAVSTDLIKWEFQPPLDVPFAQECPDVFKIGSTWYLIGGSQYLISANPRGPYRTIGDSVIDPPFIYAGKRMFDGRRHVWTGWLRDREGNTDSGNLLWGGTQCLPRELYQADDLSLGCKPIDEATSAFGNPVTSLAGKSEHKLNLPLWTESADALIGRCRSDGSQVIFNAPANYLLECTLDMKADSAAQITMRENGRDGYKLMIDLSSQTALLKGNGIDVSRRISVSENQPVKVKAFVLGTMLEIFVDDRYALSCRAYDFPSGDLGLSVLNGEVKVTALGIREEKRP